MISTASAAIWVCFFSVIDLKNISFRIRTVHNPSPLFKSSREGGNITHFAKLLSKIDRDMNFLQLLILIIIHQTRYEKSDWSRAINQFTIACEPDMINVICAADITFIMSSSTSVWLLSPLEGSPQKQNG